MMWCVSVHVSAFLQLHFKRNRSVTDRISKVFQHIWHRGLSKSGAIDELNYRSEDVCSLLYIKSARFWIVKMSCTQHADCTDVHHGADVLTAAGLADQLEKRAEQICRGVRGKAWSADEVKGISGLQDLIIFIIIFCFPVISTLCHFQALVECTSANNLSALRLLV